MALKRTALYDVHKSLGAKMVEFAGYEMPVQYKGIREEHRRVRETVGVFDVSHMGEIEIYGDSALNTVQKLTINDAAKLVSGKVQYSAMCYENAGIIDDILIYKQDRKFLLVVNASNKEKDLIWIIDHKLDHTGIHDISDQITQLAVQGKKAEDTLQKLTKVALKNIAYYSFVEETLADVPMIISRTGYTGEPGFELYFMNEYAVPVWEAVFEAGTEYQIEPVGLAARDSLRLEKKMYLYGNDIDQTTNPLEAGLDWITKLDKGPFIGSEYLKEVKEQGVKRKMVAFILSAPGFPRKDYKIYKNGKECGVVTSGTVSPVLEKGIGLGYVAVEYSAAGTQIEIEVRNKRIPAEIIKPPFVK